MLSRTIYPIQRVGASARRKPIVAIFVYLDNVFGCVHGQHDETWKKERAIYYISKKFTPFESFYTLLGRTCCALTWIAQKLRHYLSSYTTYLISRMDPLKYIFQMAMLIENLAKGQMFFDLKVDKSASLG